MNKKMVAVLVSAMMTMGLLTGCKSSGSKSGDAGIEFGCHNLQSTAPLITVEKAL